MKRGILIFLVSALLTLAIFFARAQEEDVEALPDEPSNIEIPSFEAEEDIEALPPGPSGEEIPPFESEEEALPSEEGVPAFTAEEETREPKEVSAEEAVAEEPKETAEKPAVRKRVLPEEAIPEGTELVLKAYEVKRGDCLWNIADLYYRDPFLWREIWTYNDYIKDPHWIFPGDDLVIPTYRKVEQLAETPQELEVGLEELKPGAEYEKDIFIAPPDFRVDGYIAGIKEKKFMTAYGDLVFIDLGKKQNVKPKTRYIIYREGDEVIHPATGELMGIIVEKIGVLEVTADIEEDTSTALIIDSRKPIEIGDSIKLQAKLKEAKTE